MGYRTKGYHKDYHHSKSGGFSKGKTDYAKGKNNMDDAKGKTDVTKGYKGSTDEMGKGKTNVAGDSPASSGSKGWDHNSRATPSAESPQVIHPKPDPKDYMVVSWPWGSNTISQIPMLINVFT